MEVQQSRVTNQEAAQAIRIIRAFLDQLAVDAAAVTESPALLGDAHFTLGVAGSFGSGKPYGGHDYQIWLHADGWAENVSHTDPTKLVLKAYAMAQMADEIRNMKLVRDSVASLTEQKLAAAE